MVTKPTNDTHNHNKKHMAHVITNEMKHIKPTPTQRHLTLLALCVLFPNRFASHIQFISISPPNWSHSLETNISNIFAVSWWILLCVNYVSLQFRDTTHVLKVVLNQNLTEIQRERPIYCVKLAKKLLKVNIGWYYKVSCTNYQLESIWNGCGPKWTLRKAKTKACVRGTSTQVFKLSRHL